LVHIQTANHFKSFTKEIEVLLNPNRFKKEFMTKQGLGNIVGLIYKNMYL
tara:strand:- start:255 stop:404 length:150 start_codon:yes stop_codon:yes gene_type:complete